MKKQAAAILVGCAFLTNAQTPAAAQPTPGMSWDWQLTVPLELARNVAIFDLHPDLVTAADIAALKARGVYTICYLSVGTLENSAGDRDSFPPHVIGKIYADWPAERFLDIRQLDILMPLMLARFANCKAQGFEAVEPDNLDVFENDSGFDLTAIDGEHYALALADMAHGLGLGIAQKNTRELTSKLVDTFDFAISESCYHDDWCTELQAYTDRGKAILNAEYLDTDVDFIAACHYAQSAQISMILKDRDLTEERTHCP